MDNEQYPFLELNELDCSAVESLLSCYVDGELLPALTTRFSDHLQSCESCQELLADFEQVVALARSIGARPIPAGVSQRLRQALKERVGYDVTQMKPALKVVERGQTN